jgi:uncharacterized protein YdiU (UPF0061 family)
MARNRVDYTILFRALAAFDSGPDAKNAQLRDLFLAREDFDAWAKSYGTRLRAIGSNDAERAERMKRANPKYVLRNYLAETAIQKARDERDYSEIERLRGILSRPFDEQPEFDDYAMEPPDWAREIAVSCSS